MNDFGQSIVSTVEVRWTNSQNFSNRFDELNGWLMNATFVAAHSGAAGRLLQTREDTKFVLWKIVELPYLPEPTADCGGFRAGTTRHSAIVVDCLAYCSTLIVEFGIIYCLTEKGRVMTVFKSMMVVAVLVLVAGCGGCSSTMTPISRSLPVPIERIYVKTLHSDSLLGTLVFVKDEGTWASIGYHQVFIDGKLVASMKTGERLTMDVDAGDHILGILPVPFTSTKGEFLGGYATTSLDQNVKGGTSYHYRILVDGDNSSRIQRYIPVLNQ